MTTLLEFASEDARPNTWVTGSECNSAEYNCRLLIGAWVTVLLQIHSVHSSASGSRPYRQNSLTLVRPSHLMKTDDRSAIRATHSSHLCSWSVRHTGDLGIYVHVCTCLFEPCQMYLPSRIIDGLGMNTCTYF